MIKRIILLLLTLCFLLFSCSCKGYRETDNEYFVSSVSFEKKEEKFRAFVEVLIISSDDKKAKNKLFDALGKTPYDAVISAVSSMPKTAVFDHCSTAVIGKDIYGKDFKSIIKYLYDTKNLNLGIYMFTAENIEEILGLKPQSPSIGYDIMQIEANIKSVTGIDFKNKYYETCSRQISNGGFCLPEVSVKDDKPFISGQVVYSDYSTVLSLNADEALIYNLIYSGSNSGEIEVQNKKCRVNRISTDIKTSKNTLKIDVKCRYRHSKDQKDAAIKKDIENLVNKLYGNPALKVLGAASYKKITTAEVSVNGK